jgi:hypothetical protein
MKKQQQHAMTTQSKIIFLAGGPKRETPGSCIQFVIFSFLLAVFSSKVFLHSSLLLFVLPLFDDAFMVCSLICDLLFHSLVNALLWLVHCYLLLFIVLFIALSLLFDRSFNSVLLLVSIVLVSCHCC